MCGSSKTPAVVKSDPVAEADAAADSAVIRLMEMIVAAELAYAVTASASLQASLKNEAEFMFRQAKAQDGQENPAQELDG